MSHTLATLDAWLSAHVHPGFLWLALTGAIWIAVYLIRRFLPALWLRFEAFGPDGNTAARVFQALPAVLLGAIAAVFLSGGDFASSWKGAAAGALAPLWHHLLKAYRGEVARKVILPLLAFSLIGCGGSAPALPSGECLDEYIQIAAVHQAELVQVCLTANDIEACVASQPDIDSKADRALSEWEKRCKQ